MLEAVLYTSVGALCLIRGVFRPVRALVKRGEIRRCSGTNSFGICDPSIGLLTDVGEPTMAAAPGKIVAVGADYVHLLASNEPVVLMYQGILPRVAVGQHVAPGQKVGESSGNLNFSVTQMGPGGLSLIPPSAWLASRGFQVSYWMQQKNLWCAQGRHISVPSEARQKCDMKRPEGASFAVLPVSVELN